MREDKLNDAISALNRFWKGSDWAFVTICQLLEAGVAGLRHYRKPVIEMTFPVDEAAFDISGETGLTDKVRDVLVECGYLFLLQALTNNLYVVEKNGEIQKPKGSKPFVLGEKQDARLTGEAADLQRKAESFPAIIHDGTSLRMAIHPRVMGDKGIYYLIQVGVEGEAPGTCTWNGLLRSIRRHLQNELPLPAPSKTEPPTGLFPVPFGPTMIDGLAADIIKQVHKINFPKKLPPALENLKAAEIERLQREKGETAFNEKLLWRKQSPLGSEVVNLSAEAERHLKRNQPDGYVLSGHGKDYVCRVFPARGGQIELGISGHTRLMKDGRKMMEAILGQVRQQGRNLIRMPAPAFKVLLEIESNRNWKPRVERALEALRDCSFRVDTYGMRKHKGFGSFLGEWWYVGAGSGAHGEGAYFLDVQSGFIGCLCAFEDGVCELSGRKGSLFNFAKKLTSKKKKELGWNGGKGKASFVRTDSGDAFYAVAEGLSPQQENLISFLEKQFTLKKDQVSKSIGVDREDLRAQNSSPDAKEPRVYGSEFCPLLNGKYHGALGHFTGSAEAGWTLFGARSTNAGLKDDLGYTGSERRIAKEMLEDFQVVVEKHLGGVVVARDSEEEWMTLEEASGLPMKELKIQKFYFFLPETWREDRKRKWEEIQKARAEKGETPKAWKVSVETVGEDKENKDLRILLRKARKARGLSQADAGKEFGVSQAIISNWEAGPGKSGSLIPPERVSEVRNWVGL
jgi:DNA-binding XRE family transcriptional regulator